MKRISLMLVLCLAAVAAFSAVAAGSASATEPLLLLKLTKGEYPATYTIKESTANSELQTKNSKIICGETSGSGSFENAHLGLALILFKKCKVVATIGGLKVEGPCNSEFEGKEEGEGIIHLHNWPVHFGGVKLKEGKEDPGILILVPSGLLVLICHTNAGNIKIEVKGEGVVGLLMTLAGAVPSLRTPYSSLNLVFSNNGTQGEQLDKEFLLPLKENEIMTTSLTSKAGALPSESAAQVSSNGIEAFKNSKGEATEVEIEEG